MNDPEKAIRDSDAFMRPYQAKQSESALAQAVRAMKQARFLFYCSLVLVAALAFLVGSDVVFGHRRTPLVGTFVVVLISVAVTWQRYQKARVAVAQDHGPAA